MQNQQVTLTKATLLHLIRQRGAEPHTVLAETPVWRSEEARRAEQERVNTELAHLGLIGPRGIDPDLEALVDTLARPTLEYYAWVQGNVEGQEASYTLLAGSAGVAAFILARNTERETVALSAIPREELLNNFVAQLPRHTPGQGQPLVLPKSALTGGGRPAQNSSQVMRSIAPDANSRATAELHRILNLRRIGGGSLYVATRTYAGSKHRIDRPVNYIDTVEGRWLTEERPGSGEPLIACTPATPQLLADRLRTAQGQLPT